MQAPSLLGDLLDLEEGAWEDAQVSKRLLGVLGEDLARHGLDELELRGGVLKAEHLLVERAHEVVEQLD